MSYDPSSSFGHIDEDAREAMEMIREDTEAPCQFVWADPEAEGEEGSEGGEGGEGGPN